MDAQIDNFPLAASRFALSHDSQPLLVRKGSERR